MSNRSIVITEKQIVDAMDEMCYESLCPEYHDAWEKEEAYMRELEAKHGH